ncbi:MAG: ABC transporter permease, partial [Lautropia sp.]|nr:ABC transporter permease [Lautropia sp.]
MNTNKRPSDMAQPAPPSAARPAADKARQGGWFNADTRQKMLAFLSLIVLIAVFGALRPDAFLTQDNMMSILMATAVNGVLAIACTFVIITAGIDLSVGVLMTFCAVIGGVLMVNLGWPLWAGIPMTLATGAFCGMLSGLAITKLRVAPFIATLGM